MRVLIVEDERPLALALRRGLEDEGFVVDTAFDGAEGLSWGESDAYDVIVLDLMLPAKPGLDVCRALRARGVRARILVLTAMDRASDVAHGLDAGADEYVRKPVAFEEFLARVRALSRAPRASRARVVDIGGVTIDLTTRRVAAGARTVDLTVSEYRLLEYLAVHMGEVIDSSRIADALWERDAAPDSNVAQVLASALRRKLPELRDRIEAVRRIGYRLSLPGKSGAPPCG